MSRCLRVLEERVVRCSGGARPISVDFRFGRAGGTTPPSESGSASVITPSDGPAVPQRRR